MNGCDRIAGEIAGVEDPSDMGLPGWRLHPMKADRKGVQVSGNWRLVFEFDNEEAVGVDLVDYH